jgi:hypothetical protein
VAALGGNGRAVDGFETVAYGSNALQLVHDYSNGLVPGHGGILPRSLFQEQRKSEHLVLSGSQNP